MSLYRSTATTTVVARSAFASDPWDSCLDVDPFTGQPDHQHGDHQHEHGDGCIERECCE